MVKENNSKICKVCKEEKDISEFYYRKRNKRYFNQCIACLNNKRRKDYFKTTNWKIGKKVCIVLMEEAND